MMRASMILAPFDAEVLIYELAERVFLIKTIHTLLSRFQKSREHVSQEPKTPSEVWAMIKVFAFVRGATIDFPPQRLLAPSTAQLDFLTDYVATFTTRSDDLAGVLLSLTKFDKQLS